MSFREAAARGESLVNSVKRADQRARLYGLADDGASEAAQRRRSRKDSIAHRKRFILAIEKRQAGKSLLKPLAAEAAAALTARHLAAIARLRAELADTPHPGVLAPMTRRVAREDRRRPKNAKK